MVERCFVLLVKDVESALESVDANAEHLLQMIEGIVRASQSTVLSDVVAEVVAVC